MATGKKLSLIDIAVCCSMDIDKRFTDMDIKHNRLFGYYFLGNQVYEFNALLNSTMLDPMTMYSHIVAMECINEDGDV